jgi:hypothetical protein
MAIGDIVGIRIVGRFQQQNIVHTMHYKIIAQAVSEALVLGFLSDLWETEFKTDWLAMHVDTYKLMGIRAFGKVGVNKQPGITHIDEAGGVALDESPSPLCRTITLYTESDNYRRRGRLMLSGCTVSDFDAADGAVSGSMLGTMQAFGTAVIANIDAGGTEFQPGLAPTDVLPFEPFTSAMARKTPSVVRSRRVRGFSIG